MIRARLSLQKSDPLGLHAASRRRMISRRKFSQRTSFLTGSAFVPGSQVIPPEVVDREFGMPEGKLRRRAGIESISRAARDENETSLGAEAARRALRSARCGVERLDWILATSETHLAYPSLAAQLHVRLLARETCGVLDIGGACLGLLNAFAAAQAFLAAGPARAILVVTADVHSCILTPDRVVGEFGGLFGDGASAFLLRGESAGEAGHGHMLGAFQFGCASQYAGAIQVSLDARGSLGLQFDGDALSRAAVSRLKKVIGDVELRSGLPLAGVAAFATHQPNPRLVDLLARQLDAPSRKFPPIAKRCGNLGSTTCAAALQAALEAQSRLDVTDRRPIVLASLGPGLLWGGGWVDSLRR